jgi:4-hydroxy-2-oxoheptanedioate aldolase
MMRPNRLKEIWANGKAATNCWLAIPSIMSAEIIAHQVWDSLTIDMQHGQPDYAAMVAMLVAISSTPSVPLARVPWNNPGDVMRALDAGVYGVICPNVDTVEQCTQFVQAALYAPLGWRSVGPHRAVLYGGNDYLAKANETTLRIVQIESAQALQNVDAISKVEGVDMLYIGPSDLGLSLGRVPRADPTDPVTVKAIDDILAAAKRAGVKAGIFCASVDYSKQMIAKGFDLVTVTSDQALLSGGAKVAQLFR